MDRDSTLFHRVYNSFIRERLPYKISVHNGIPVQRDVRLLDFTDSFPEYEMALIPAIQAQVQSNDNIVVVGGGLGVSTVAAAEATGRTGTVNTYEASRNQFNITKSTVELNKLEKYVTVHHAIVGSYQSEYTHGSAGNAEIIQLSSLPNDDILVLDCEGAELEILADLNQNYRTIIVETHGFLDAPENEIENLLSENGYDVIERRVESESAGIVVLTAIKDH